MTHARMFRPPIDTYMLEINNDITIMMDSLSHRVINRAPELPYLWCYGKEYSPNQLRSDIKDQRERLLILARIKNNEDITPDEHHLLCQLPALKKDKMILEYPNIDKIPLLRITSDEDIPLTEEQIEIMNRPRLSL